MLGWIDEEVVVDSNLVASRKAGDIPAFNRGMIKLFEQSRGKARTLTAS
jgi:putative intracellular protease/amidase